MKQKPDKRLEITIFKSTNAGITVLGYRAYAPSSFMVFGTTKEIT